MRALSKFADISSRFSRPSASPARPRRLHRRRPHSPRLRRARCSSSAAGLCPTPSKSASSRWPAAAVARASWSIRWPPSTPTPASRSPRISRSSAPRRSGSFCRTMRPTPRPRRARLDGVTGIWFGGGDQARLTAAIGRTKRRGGDPRGAISPGAVVGGTSAGAAVMSTPMITGDETPARRRPAAGKGLERRLHDDRARRRRDDRRLRAASRARSSISTSSGAAAATGFSPSCWSIRTWSASESTNRPRSRSARKGRGGSSERAWRSSSTRDRRKSHRRRRLPSGRSAFGWPSCRPEAPTTCRRGRRPCPSRPSPRSRGPAAPQTRPGAARRVGGRSGGVRRASGRG